MILKTSQSHQLSTDYGMLVNDPNEALGMPGGSLMINSIIQARDMRGG